MSNEAIKALILAQNKIAASRAMCDDIDAQLWDTYESAISSLAAPVASAAPVDVLPYMVPAGFAIVPIEPTEDMVIDGFESAPDRHLSTEKVWSEYKDLSGCQQAAYRARACWAAMLAKAPEYSPTAPDQPAA